ncbi:MAG: TolC family protein [Bacteroidaceae bacterium]|nr:TolC family protein [Bacteroidaceae bacterium]
MKKVLLLLTLIFTLTEATAQNISYGEYMERVFKDNIALTAQRMDIDIANAAVTDSKVYNDPSIALTYTNNEDWSKGLGQGIEFELSRTFTFGVRRSRIDLAESERTQAVALLEEYIRNFRADATIAYLEHLRAKMLFAEATEIHDDLCEVSTNDSLRYLRGDIAKSDWLESRMAQGVAKNTMLAAEAELRNSAIKLGYYMGDVTCAAQLDGSGSLEIAEAALPLEKYTQAALEHRADLVVALGKAEIAVAAQKFNKAQRRPELDVTLGATYNIADPNFTTIKAGVAMPLKFSNLNKGARLMDELLVKQANVGIEEARLVVTAEVMQAYNNFKYATKQSETFSSEMLGDMRQVVDSKRKAYEMGEIAFLDYLIVQRNESEMRGEYIDALFGKAVAWVELQRSVGVDLKFGAQPTNE